MCAPKAILVSVLLVAPCAGFGRLELNPEDVIVVPGRPALFATAFERKFTLASSDDLENAPVEFYFDGKLVGRALTDDHGNAETYCELPAARLRPDYRLRACYGGESVEASGRVFYWDPRRTVVAVDVDETISRTHYSDLFIADLDRHSRPLDGAAAALWELSHHYQLLYISARPRCLNGKTRRWLAAHGFPPGPVANALRFEACFHQRRYKQEMLARLRQRFPNILIGIGDKKVDDLAYGANGMLAIIIDRPLLTRYGGHCLVFGDWYGVSSFFESQRSRLTDPRQLASLIDTKGKNLHTAFASTATHEPVPEEPIMDGSAARASVVQARLRGDVATP